MGVGVCVGVCVGVGVWVWVCAGVGVCVWVCVGGCVAVTGRNGAQQQKSRRQVHLAMLWQSQTQRGLFLTDHPFPSPT